MWPEAIHARRPWVIVLAILCVLAIALLDRRVHSQVPLALLYIGPAALAGVGLSKTGVPLFGAFCTLVAESADAFTWNVTQGVPRDVLYFAVYTIAGLYVSEVLAKQRLEREHVVAVERESQARLNAEEQLRLLLASSSIAILTSDAQGRIVYANETAERLFASERPSLTIQGTQIEAFVPALAGACMRSDGQGQLRTMMQCEGVRGGSEAFLADVWFSTYRTNEGVRLTAMIADASEDVRDREEATAKQVLTGSRLLIGAVSHEIRNVSAAITLVQQNLVGERSELSHDDNFQALRQLTSALQRIASVELSQVQNVAGHVHLDSFLRDLRIIIGSSLRDAEITLEWKQPGNLPPVWGDQQSLVQVFLNLVRNAEAALSGSSNPKLALSVTHSRGVVEVRLSDNGPGVRNPEHLFHPFRAAANNRDGRIGLGLYLSRALVRSFRGELRYEPTASGATFVVDLVPASLAQHAESECAA